VFTIHEGQVYRARVEPLDADVTSGDVAEVALDVHAAWQTLLRSFSWLPSFADTKGILE
jgi:hypothetical protein